MERSGAAAARTHELVQSRLCRFQEHTVELHRFREYGESRLAGRHSTGDDRLIEIHAVGDTRLALLNRYGIRQLQRSARGIPEALLELSEHNCFLYLGEIAGQ